MPRTSRNPTEKPPLEKALEQNDAVQDSVERSAQELLMVSKVLEKQIAPSARTGDVGIALKKTAELEDQIQDSAEELAHVNRLLEQEVAERASIEKQLRELQAPPKQKKAEIS